MTYVNVLVTYRFRSKLTGDDLNEMKFVCNACPDTALVAAIDSHLTWLVLSPLNPRREDVEISLNMKFLRYAQYDSITANQWKCTLGAKLCQANHCLVSLNQHLVMMSKRFMKKY